MSGWAEADLIIQTTRRANQVAAVRGLNTASAETVKAALDAQAEQGQSNFFLALDESSQAAQLEAIGYLFKRQEKTQGGDVRRPVH